MTDRRKFIKLSLAGASGLAVLYVGYRYISPLEKLIYDILVQDLKGLNVKEEDIKQFSKKAAEQNPWHMTYTKIKFITLYHTFDFKWLNLPYKYKYVQARAYIVSFFLFSTDFFLNKMDESKPVKYSGIIYSPYNKPCSNPFSAIYYSNQVAS